MANVARLVGPSGPFEFRTVETDQVVAVVRAWAEARWPMGRRRAFALARRLGWVSSAEDPELMNTPYDLRTGDQDAGLDFDGLPSKLYEVEVDLSSVAPQDADEQSGPVTRAVFEDYVRALVGVYGPGTVEDDDDGGGQTAEWLLPTNVTVALGWLPGTLSVSINSPDYLDEVREEQEYFEQYGEEFGEEF